MCLSNVLLFSGTSAPGISSIAGRTSVPRMSTCRYPNHLTDTVRCRTAVSWMDSRKLDRPGDPRHERRFAIGPAPLVKRWPHRAQRPVVRVQGQPRFFCKEGSTCEQSRLRSEEHTSELPSLMRTSYAVFYLKKHNKKI